MIEKLWPITLTRDISDIHSGGFSMQDETSMGFGANELFETPRELFELVTFHKKNLKNNLEKYKIIIASNPEYKEIQNNIFVHTTAKIDDQVVFSTENGIIVVEQDVHINPFTYISGPVRIDSHATINPHTSISNSYIGKYCKIGGEVSNSVFESYSNKGHHGYVGDSYIGSWVNIGGGSSTSNLKNTYGTIKLAGIETGEQFMGSIIADHSKISINTSIYTGKVIGMSSHVYGTVTMDIPSFTNYISKDNMILLPLDIATKVAEKMKRRRNLELTKEEADMLSYAYTATLNQRVDSGVVEGKLAF